jgi:hypothetical protein
MRPLFPLTLLLFLGACDGGEDAAPTLAAEPQPQQQVQQQRKEDPAEELQDKVGEAIALADSGRHGEAVAALEALLEKKADDAAWWQLLRQEAVLSGEAGALLDRLDADTAIGGNAAAHQRLRAHLALAANRPADALTAAKKLRTTEDEEGAALWVAAWRAQAADQRSELDPANLDPTRVGDALVLAATGSKSKRRTLLKDLAPTHPRARLLRATLLEDVGEKNLVAGVLAELLDDADLELRQFAAMATGQASPDPAVAAGHFATAARAATEAHNGAAAGRTTGMAVSRYLNALRSDEALAVATELHAPRFEAKDTAGSAATGLAVARAALAAGELQIALAHARDASLAFIEGEDAGNAATAAWIQAEAAWHLGLSEEIADAATRAGDHKATVEALGLVLTGRSAEAVGVLSKATLQGPHGVQALLAGARAASYSGGDAIGIANRAAKAADALGHLPSRIEARLAVETYAVAAGNSRAASTARSELGRLAAGLESGTALAAEVGARTIRSGGKATFAEDAPAASAAWTALAGGVVPAASEGENPILGWARARAATKAGDSAGAYEAYRTAVAASPRHLAGPWTPASVLDGGAGAGTEADMAQLHGRSNLMSGLAALAIHDDWRSRDDVHVAFGIGDDPSLALEIADRMALNEAHRRHAVQTVRWFAGAADAPDASARTLAELEKKARDTKGFSRALPLPPADYLAVQESLRHLAVLSYRLGGRTGDAVVVTSSGARVLKLEDVDGIRKNAVALRAGLISANAVGGPPTSPLPGDALRVSLVDIFQQDLLGIGRYLVLPDGPLWGFSFNVFPEQKKGLRFLADIRSIGNSSTLAQAFKEQERPPLTYNPDFLGLAPFPPQPTAASGNLTLPTEVGNAGRLFGSGLREVFERDQAKAEIFREKGPTARFLHMSDITSGDRGALGFADAEVPLQELRNMDLVAQAAILSTTSSPEVMRRRGQALVASGARAVILTSWLVPETVRGKYLYTFYEAGNRDRPPSRAMVEAREAIQKNPQEPNFDPSFWGQFILHGAP